MTTGHAWLALSLIPGLGGRTAKMLLEGFGSPENILGASAGSLAAVPGLRPGVADAIRAGPDGAALEKEIRNLGEMGARVCGLGDPEYPGLLGEIHDPPMVLYLKGRPLESDRFRVAMVGTRSPTGDGAAVAREIAGGLARAGVEVVSGLALGIDSECHLGALEGGGSTVAVLGCGIGIVYPPERRRLHDRIVESGTLVSEFPVGATPLPQYFPRRNRIISGLSVGVVVVEAAERSGALITADCALEQGREVMAVPGNPRSRVSAGVNRLIREGACLVTSAEEVLEELVPGDRRVREAETPQVPGPEGPEEERILAVLAAGRGLVDEISVGTGMSVSVVLERLLAMELRGVIRRGNGARYERR